MNSIEDLLICKIRDEIPSADELTEIRMRVNCPLILNGVKYEKICEKTIITEKDIDEQFNIFTGFSAYAYENEIRNGYLTIKGGHRIGFGGEAVTGDGRICSIKNIRFINMRLCHCIEGCGDGIFEELYGKGLCNILIISPPGKGKTTLLRELVKKCSENFKRTSVCVVDERNEISGSYMGKPSIFLGFRTDVITKCSKYDGIQMAVRALSPGIIAVDEIGGDDDLRALKYAAQSGVYIMATLHGKDLSDAREKIGQAFERMFERKIIIKDWGVYECC